PPLWCALLLEGRGALAGVLGLADGQGDLALLVEHLGAAPLGRLDDHALGGPYGEWAVRGDGATELQGGLEAAALRREPVDQGDLVRAGGRDQLAGEGPLHGQVVR